MGRLIKVLLTNEFTIYRINTLQTSTKRDKTKISFYKNHSKKHKNNSDMKPYLDDSDQLISDSIAYPILESPSPILIDQISTDQALQPEDSNKNIRNSGETVSIKDWFKLFRLGIGNLWFAVAIILGALNSLLYLLMYYVLGEWSKIENSGKKNGVFFYYYISIILGSTLLI